MKILQRRRPNQNRIRNLPSELSDVELLEEELLELDEEEFSELEDSSLLRAISGTGTGFGRDSKCSRRSSL